MEYATPKMKPVYALTMDELVKRKTDLKDKLALVEHDLKIVEEEIESRRK